MNSTERTSIEQVFGVKFAEYLSKNAAGWVIERFADTSTVRVGPNTGRKESICFAATSIGKEILYSHLRSQMGH